MDRSKEAVARRLAEAHYSIEPGIELIVQLLSDREVDTQEPIKLLEVNANTTSEGIQPIFFGPHVASGIFYPSVIIEVTPAEYKHIQRHPDSLPNGWRLGPELGRPVTVG